MNRYLKWSWQTAEMVTSLWAHVGALCCLVSWKLTKAYIRKSLKNQTWLILLLYWPNSISIDVDSQVVNLLCSSGDTLAQYSQQQKAFETVTACERFNIFYGPLSSPARQVKIFFIILFHFSFTVYICTSQRLCTFHACEGLWLVFDFLL